MRLTTASASRFPNGTMATSMRASGSASAKSNRVSILLNNSSTSCPKRRRASICRAVLAKAWRWSRDSVATSSSGCGSTPTARSRAVTYAIRHGSSGRCSKRRSKATSSPTSRCATNRSTAPTPATISEAAMRKHIFQGMIRAPLTEPAPMPDDAAMAELAQALERGARQRLGRSLSIRAVDAGSCNGCELEIHALSNAFYDLERLGLRFVASPRHADVLLVTGPLTRNMRDALESAWHAMPDPKWVVAVGDCAVDGGVFTGSPACVTGGVGAALPTDLHIRGCPPRPIDLVKGLLALLEAQA